VSDSQKGFKLTHELRILVASLLSIVVILAWAHYFGPRPPAQGTRPQATQPAQTAPSTPNPSTPTPPPTGSAAGQHGPATAIAAPAKTNIVPKSEGQERTIIVENDLYRVEFSNRGGVVKSWQLKKYFDDAKPPHILDVVHPEAAQQTNGWPFALVLDDEELEKLVNSALFVPSVPTPSPQPTPAKQPTPLPANPLKPPSELDFFWSDGHIEVTKRFHFDHTYVVRAETSVKVNGAPVVAGLAWLGGFGDLTVANPAPIETVSVFYSENGKLNAIPAKKLDGPEKWPRGTWAVVKDWTGIEDRYFAAAFLPPNGPASGSLETRYWKVPRTVKVEDKDTEEPVPQMATAASGQPQLALRVYVGPKDYDELKKMNPPLQSLVNFGWLEFIADPLFHGLKWLQNYIPNWGWDIVVLTLIINMLLFPLRISSYRTTLKMQRVAPEVKQIQEKYKKYSMRDPRKAEMNKEVMAVYAREKINPVGGCFQMFLQMPIWFGLNTALRYAIELRHAPWLWVHDLSAKDPFYILPITMGASMYFVSKMTPMTATDPQQQMMMKIMPITMAGMFVVFPISSGLAIYILTSSLVGIVQQWYLNRTHPLPAQTKPVKASKGNKKK
jgi:YidC/Oxa1 family membrane protein insertase